MPIEGDWELHFDARRPIPEVVAGKLEELIDSGRLPRGEALPNENELARRFAVSRSSVRTALQALQHRGLVEVTRGRGWSTTVHPPTLPDDALAQPPRYESGGPVVDAASFRLTQIFEVRQAIESSASSLAAITATSSDLRAIEMAHLAHLRTDPEDADALLATDEAFHTAIFDAAGDDTLIAALRPILPAVRDFRRLCFSTDSSGAGASSLGHQLVLDALMSGDSAAAKQAMTAHLLMFAARIGPLSPLIAT